ncbi:hypothetical protein N7U66_10515 [Lacinutrix neustonica]|uniref:Uncharacterized protein n=1 Tax=Lacinutrix neustonica TaxID=2980107 RepID=A0A9E8MZM5_9FLAO|nr:hypothetical protein [Lacinutrix neustonica]WAC03804.1 hypothetical protein N7U66_10515 [Lacinutrix neustonica]
MNNKLKQYIKLTILSLGAVLFINSCQKDDEFQTTKNDPSTYQARFKISKIDRPKIEENTSLVKNLLKIEDKQEKEKRHAIASKDIYPVN